MHDADGFEAKRRSRETDGLEDAEGKRRASGELHSYTTPLRSVATCVRLQILKIRPRRAEMLFEMRSPVGDGLGSAARSSQTADRSDRVCTVTFDVGRLQACEQLPVVFVTNP